MENFNQNSPLVSIVVITYNSDKYIIETLQSIFDQTYENIELIISDDGSKDETITVCKKWLDNFHVRFVRAELITTAQNSGTAGNLNRGISAAKGIWIKPIAGDDALFPDVIKNYISYIKKENKILCIHSNSIEYEENFQEKNRLPNKDASKYKINSSNIDSDMQFEILLRCCPVGTPTAMYHKSVFQQVGNYDERFPLWEDRPMFLKMTLNGIKLHYLDIDGAKYRVRNDSVVRFKNKNMVSRFKKDRSEALEVLFLNHLNGIERSLNVALIKLNIFFYKKGNNSSLLKVIYNVLTYPLQYFLSKINNRYR
tara:strand:+ start:5297 stop:6232 length:936 start_codon:yes stop_codon:yes gene_type:complete